MDEIVRACICVGLRKTDMLFEGAALYSLD